MSKICIFTKRLPNMKVRGKKINKKFNVFLCIKFKFFIFIQIFYILFHKKHDISNVFYLF